MKGEISVIFNSNSTGWSDIWFLMGQSSYWQTKEKILMNLHRSPHTRTLKNAQECFQKSINYTVNPQFNRLVGGWGGGETGNADCPLNCTVVMPVMTPVMHP